MRLRAAFRLGRQSAEAFTLRVSVVGAGLGRWGLPLAGLGLGLTPANEAAPPPTDRGRAGGALSKSAIKGRLSRHDARAARATAGGLGWLRTASFHGANFSAR